MNRENVYIVINSKALVDPEKNVIVEDLGDVYCTKPDIKKSIENIQVKKKNNEEDWDYITVTEITEKILSKYPYIDLKMLGEVETLIEYKSQEDKKTFLEVIKILAICILLFFGASLAIINFHEDVNTSTSMKELYYTFTGKKVDNPLLMVIPYSFGIGIGVIAFFSRVPSSSKRRQKEPGPMEVELYQYDQGLEQQILNEVKKDK